MILTLNLSEKKPLELVWKGQGLIWTFHRKVQSFIFAKSLFRSLAVVFRSRTIVDREVSSAKSFGFVIKLSNKKLMYIKIK